MKQAVTLATLGATGVLGAKVSVNPFSDSTSHYVMGTLSANLVNTTKLLKDVASTSYTTASGSSITLQQAHAFDSQADADTVSSFMTKTLAEQPSAYWIDVKEKIKKGSLNPRNNNEPFKDLETVEGILDDAVAKGRDLVTFIVYDLPNRDCQALASNGQLCCDGSVTLGESPCSGDSISRSDCEPGMKVYKSQYIDELFAMFSKFPASKLKNLVLIIEPDSLPNASTGTTQICTSAATIDGYKRGIAYAIGKLSTLDNAVMYLDAAHGGWMGWTNNLDSFAQNVKALTVPADVGNSNSGKPVSTFMRGFAINTANYEADEDLHNYEHLLEEWNCAVNNVAYATGENKACPGGKIANCPEIPQDKRSKCISLADHFPESYFVIDSGRNGNPCSRKGAVERATWCNPVKSALGKLPLQPTESDGWVTGSGAGFHAMPASVDKKIEKKIEHRFQTTDYAKVDAFYWLKTPGESDGCSFDSCPRLDRNCQLENCMGAGAGVSTQPAAPEAGKWYDYQIIELAKNSVFEDKYFPGCKPTDLMGANNPFVLYA
jgi:cellulose 1,4-beta-cellobiosidase